MSAALITLCGSAGVYLIVSAIEQARRPSTSERHRDRDPWMHRVRRWLDQAGLDGVSVGELAGATTLLAAIGALFGALSFGGVVPALGAATLAGGLPLATYRKRRRIRRAAAEDAWPALVEEIRVQCGSAGRSIPQALLDVGLRGPEELRSGFLAARRTWAVTTDFGLTVATLKDHLTSPTADAVCETLLVAHELGGSDLDRRLAEFAADRREDALTRKDARSKQAGVRFARRFVVIVPIGMAFAGMSLGNGRAAYQTPTGQALVAAGIALVAACWVWSGRILRLPEEERVFA